MSRPIIDIELKPIDQLLIGLSCMSIIFMITICSINYNILPDNIPIHFNFKGEPDSFGSKKTIWIFPIISLFLFAVLYFTSKVPHKFNYPVKITSENAPYQYEIASRLMRALAFIIVLGFTCLTYVVIHIAYGHIESLGSYFIIIYLAIIFGTIFYFLFKARQSK